MSRENTSGKGFHHLMEVNAKIAFHLLEPQGVNNIERIPADRSLEIVLPHFSDADLQIAAYWFGLSERFRQLRGGRRLGIAMASENYAHPMISRAVKLVGEEHFFPITTRANAQGRWDFAFNPADFERMAEAMRSGTDIIMAAHEPLANIPGAPWQLPERAGLGAAYLAEITGATVLPAAVNIHTGSPSGYTAQMSRTLENLLYRRRPDAQLHIGEPMIPSTGADQHADQDRHPRAMYRNTRTHSQEIMRAVAQLLPEEKRGRWGAPQT